LRRKSATRAKVRGGNFMVGTFSLFTVALGAALAQLADRVTMRTETIEAAAGFLLLGGFAAIGCALPAML
jgi:hypothetical protein